MNGTSDELIENVLCSRIFKTDEISAKGISECLEVSADDRIAIAKALDLLNLDSMRMDFRLYRSGRGRYKLEGQLSADAKQSCVVTLEPVECKIDEQITVEFWPPKEVEHLESEAEEEGMEVPLDGPEPILDGCIDVGHLAYEHLAAALEPYPRQAGANFDWEDPSADQSPAGSDKPFAELARLKLSKGMSTD
jgi:hypothetical protein